MNDSIEEGLNATPVGDLLLIQEYERRRIGQELHDSAGQLLISLQLSVGELRRAGDQSGQNGLLDEIGDIVAQIDQEIRALAFLHYPADLSRDGLCAAVEMLVRGFKRKTGILTSFKCIGDASHIADSVAIALLRVVQEALVNVHRHARATSAKVILEQRPGELRVSVSDDGVGIADTANKPQPRGTGLHGMRYRVETLGGFLRVMNLRHGTKVCAGVPTAS